MPLTMALRVSVDPATNLVNSVNLMVSAHNAQVIYFCVMDPASKLVPQIMQSRVILAFCKVQLECFHIYSKRIRAHIFKFG